MTRTHARTRAPAHAILRLRNRRGADRTARVVSPLPPAGGTRSGLRTAARLLAELAGFALLLFAARFLARAHLVPLIDQECHIGAIAVDVLAHGIRFPLLAYAPNEYDNGSFFSGLASALSFAVFGRNVLALKLVTHLVSAAGAVAALALLRRGLDELGVTWRGARRAAIAALVLGFALAPRVVTLASLYAVGNHAEGAAIGAILLALFAARRPPDSAPRTAAFWALVGVALYLNKGAFAVVPALAAVELWLARHAWRRLAAAAAGLLLGALPELVVITQRHGLGWQAMAAKAERHAGGFPNAFLHSLSSLADHRPELLAAWAIAVACGVGWLWDSMRRGDWRDGRSGPAAPPVALAVLVGAVLTQLAALAVMAQGELDTYAVYAYPALVVLSALVIGRAVATVAARRPVRHAYAVAAAALLLLVVVLRPDALSAGPPSVAELWRDQRGAACAWRFAEGFGREHAHGLAAPGQTRTQHAIARCRALSEPDLALDCVGGIARELHWRGIGRVAGAPPAELSAAERRAYAYAYGTHRFGDARACADFTDPALTAECAAAVRLECLAFADVTARFATGRGIGRPRCEIAVPPMDTYWASMRRALLARPAGAGPAPDGGRTGTDLSACAVFAACY